MANVEAGRVIDHQRVRAWADSLDTETPLSLPLPDNAITPGHSTTRLFAYGTLQRSFQNHYILSSSAQGARFLGTGMTTEHFALYLDEIPYISDRLDLYPVKGEVYDVDDSTLAAVDHLEGHPDWYERREIAVKLDEGGITSCWAYFHPEPSGTPGFTGDLAAEVRRRAEIPKPRGSRARTRKHNWIDERSIALHAVIAEHLRRDPSLLQRAFATLDRWGQAPSKGMMRVYGEWRHLLTTLPFEDLLAFLVSPDQEPTRLRQSSPFAGILTDGERLAIFAEFEAL
ncbi:MAG: gamma-glutamylcyclotransferase family protein [Gemmatimonadaceae bacterium]